MTFSYKQQLEEEEMRIAKSPVISVENEEMIDESERTWKVVFVN